MIELDVSRGEDLTLTSSLALHIDMQLYGFKQITGPGAVSRKALPCNQESIVCCLALGRPRLYTVDCTK